MRPSLVAVIVASLITVGIVVPDTARAEDRPPDSPNESVVERVEAVGDVITQPIVYTDRALSLTVAGPPPTTEPPPPPEPEPVPEPEVRAAPLVLPQTGSVRDRALGKLRELGAADWQLAVFDCIGFNESGWQSKRSNRQNPNGTWDHGPFQINDVHWPNLNAQHLDPYVPEDAAVYVWQLSRQGTRFSPWSVAPKCGV